MYYIHTVYIYIYTYTYVHNDIYIYTYMCIIWMNAKAHKHSAAVLFAVCLIATVPCVG